MRETYHQYISNTVSATAHQLIQIFDQNLIFVAENHVYKHFGNVCNDEILMPQLLEVVRQHILGVVGNVLYFSVANLTDFPAVKEV